MTDHGFRVYREIEAAICRLAKDSGAEVSAGPLVPGDPHSGTGRFAEPLAGIGEAVALERAARFHARRYIRLAREAGRSWQEIAEVISPGSPAQVGYAYAVPGYFAGDYANWRCSCGRLVRDLGPELAPAEAELGHAPGCERLAATVAAWENAWGEDGDGLV